MPAVCPGRASLLIERRRGRPRRADTPKCMEAPQPPVRFGRDRPTEPRLLRELATIEAMTGIYCADHHGSSGPCEECKALIAYAAKRLAVCPFGAEKPVCDKCQVHCYGPAMREKVRDIMRHAGPRMMWRHPWLALAHVLDKRYVAPPRPRATARRPTPRRAPQQETSTGPESP